MSADPFPDRPAVICVTPARNEAWILERFLRAAELWADHVIVADQQSTDRTVAIARKFDKVRCSQTTPIGTTRATGSRS